MERVINKLETQLLVGVPVFILIDPMIGEPFYMGDYSEQDDLASVLALREEAWQRSIYSIELNDKIKLPPALHPYLVVLDNQDDMWLANSYTTAKNELEKAQKDGVLGRGSSVHRIGGWLQTIQSPKTLAEQLSKLMHVHTATSTDAKYQRLADRRVLSLLSHIIGEAHQQKMLGEVQAWHYLEANGLLTSYTGTGQAYQMTRLNKNEWDTFIQGESIHTVMARWLGEIASTAPMQTKYERVINALQEANIAKRAWPNAFKEEADKTAYANLYLLNPDFLHIPEVQKLLEPIEEAEEEMTFDVLKESIYTILDTKA